MKILLRHLSWVCDPAMSCILQSQLMKLIMKFVKFQTAQQLPIAVQSMKIEELKWKLTRILLCSILEPKWLRRVRSESMPKPPILAQELPAHEETHAKWILCAPPQFSSMYRGDITKSTSSLITDIDQIIPQTQICFQAMGKCRHHFEVEHRMQTQA